jgi:hypothetical protein
VGVIDHAIAKRMKENVDALRMGPLDESEKACVRWMGKSIYQKS